MQPATEYLASYLSGVVVAEGCFTKTGDPPKFNFSVGLGAADAGTCTLLQAFFAVGHIFSSPRRRPHFDDEVAFQVRKLADLVGVIVPFMDEHLPNSYKHMQYRTSRVEVLNAWNLRSARRRQITGRRPAD